MRSKVETARALGISLKRLEGWEPTRTTTYVYDGYGRVKESTTVTEPEWDEEQTDYMLALAYLEADTCDGCHGRLSESTIQEHDGIEPKFDVPPPMRCFRCTALSKASEPYHDSPQPHALRFRAERTN